MSKNEAIALYHPILYSIAYKIVGSIEDAQDIVQDTFEKWLSIDHSQVENTRAYLIRSVKNNSIQFVQSWKKRVFNSINEPELIEVEDQNQSNSIFNFDLENQLAHAWTVIHLKLEPLEKAVFVLRDIFNVEYHEMQDLFGKKADNLRKMVSRARAKLNVNADKLKSEFPSIQLPESIKTAFKKENLSDIIHELQREIAEKFQSEKK